ncbi:LysM domain-containing protein [Akanthomyces lecanii RCEF 1005]|uniref:LysM domain-containing protein n=1 Tax=Akanthomyces lecanii RCEF 1005 TaxID=1081108 RepID=A0A162LHQ6_CORDF|nr:LysM domain-containing protein [Akanthomyces lecanii RCEF 1005]
MSLGLSHGICSGQHLGNDVSFKLKSHYLTDCTGDQHNDFTIKQNTDGMCMNLDCQVGSLDIDSAGNCPNGQVQISYWQNSDCSGQWYGYGYGNRGTCRGLWKDGYKTKSVWLRCAEQSQDCVSKSSCKSDPEPSSNLC